MSYKVHCIEDNQIMQNIYKRMMNAVDFSEAIIKAYNGQEALDYYKNLINGESNGDQIVPDVIFLDLNMPVMDGWRFLDEFNKLPLPESIKPNIVIVTSSVSPVDKKKAEQYPVVKAFLTKPLTIGNLEDLKTQLNGGL